MSSTFYVSGGRALKGTVRPAGNKNAALPILAATLLADGPCRIDNVPRIRDVQTMIELLEHLGAVVSWTGPNTVEVDTSRAEPRTLDPALSARIRASILLAGPMLARFGRVTLPPPGGDVIGRRRVDTHFLALEQLGAEITGERVHPRRKAHRGRHLPRRAQRHRHRERHHGGRGGAGHHRVAQRRLRTARTGPGAIPRRLRPESTASARTP
jgi:UDP-N-acetylglucosamine enolpyruvyl transferase